jgi:hypothetical protein
MRCEIDVPSESTSLRSGQYVLVRIIGHKKDEPVTVPTAAVFKVAGVSYACVATGGKTERRRLEPGIGDGIRVAVTSGLKAGETVVVGPAAATLADGTAVEVVRPEPAKP